MSAWGFEWGEPWGAAAETEGAAWLLYMIREGPNVQAWAEIVDYRAAEVVDALRQVRDSYNLDDADGEQLDTIGAWLGLSREGLTDARYRRALQAQKNVILSSSGTGPTVLAVWDAWVTAPASWYRNIPPATVEVGGEVASGDETLLVRFLRRSLPGGVALTAMGWADDDTVLIGDYSADPITVVDGPVSTVEVVGRNLTGPGSTQQIEWASPGDLSGATWSFAAWVRVNQTTIRNRFVTISNGVAQQAFFQTHPGGDLEFSVLHATASLSVITTETLTIGQWHHVAVTYDGGTATSGVHMYIDGVEANIAFATAGAGAQNPLSGPWLLGARVVNDTVNLDGALTQPRAWDHVLTPAEIWAEYRSPGGPAKTSGLIWAPDMLTLHDPISGLTGTATGTSVVDPTDLPLNTIGDYSADPITDAELTAYLIGA